MYELFTTKLIWKSKTIMLYLNQIVQGDSIELMKQIDDNSIDLTVSSPPYDALRSYNGKIDSTKFNEYFSFPLC